MLLGGTSTWVCILQSESGVKCRIDLIRGFGFNDSFHAIKKAALEVERKDMAEGPQACI